MKTLHVSVQKRRRKTINIYHPHIHTASNIHEGERNDNFASKMQTCVRTTYYTQTGLCLCAVSTIVEQHSPFGVCSSVSSFIVYVPRWSVVANEKKTFIVFHFDFIYNFQLLYSIKSFAIFGASDSFLLISRFKKIVQYTFPKFFDAFTVGRQLAER